MLSAAVLSTSSLLPLSRLMEVVHRIHPNTSIDLFLLRDVDIREIEGVCVSIGIDTTENLVDMLADDRIVPVIINWATQSMREHPVKLSGIATYLPSISSGGDDGLTVLALVNCVRISCELFKMGLMETPIVEIVCGAMAERCPCVSCMQLKSDYQVDSKNDRAELLLVGDRTAKLNMLVAKVSEAVQMLGVYNEMPWSFGLELEPGINYVLNGGDAIREVIGILISPDVPESVRRRVGLNLDIAHYVNALVSVADVVALQEYFVHCHVCENPGMHTRDLPVGVWGTVAGADSVAKYLRTLDKIGATREKGTRPFSGRVALELEGCGRISWLQDGLARLQQRLAELT